MFTICTQRCYGGHYFVDFNTWHYYMPSKIYIVKLPLALGNIFHLNESILARSHDDAKNPY